jgi:hypothetical protein
LHPLQHAGLARRTAHNRRVTYRDTCATPERVSAFGVGDPLCLVT